MSRGTADRCRLCGRDVRAIVKTSGGGFVRVCLDDVDSVPTGISVALLPEPENMNYRTSANRTTTLAEDLAAAVAS